MRKKEMKLIITFHTTADAMAMEKACKEQNVPEGLFRCRVRYQRDADFPGARTWMNVTRSK